ncbi:pyrroloquinoline quinone biosynthesis protein PqqB [Streptomyces sp. NBC_00316]|uniref:pyrroloquinoline quinone biosynthesis protein PqqB n=1 Tax=Streptomyces sp. NBC_00316 TaxID=2975710 RepID=UPI002E28D2E5|nr:MBL fold metallo-hydrolase [Streptomyces sp. NBC_00316]
MLLRTLGTAAGGGVPQWNCACPGCTGARRHPDRRRRHDSLAVLSEGAATWCLVNAGPDTAEQIEAHPELRPGSGQRRTPVVRIILTDAELDHTLGLLRLREAEHLEIFATRPVREALRERLGLDHVLTPYTTATWRDLPLPGMAPATEVAGLRISAIPLSTKRPRYACDAPVDDCWVVAVRIEDPGHRTTALYAPALATWSDAFEKAVAEADCVFLDGTFWDNEEPRHTGISGRTATSMGHLPVAGAEGTAERLAHVAARCLYTHLNNTNPLVDPTAPQHAQLAALGLEVAQDGMLISL